MSPEAFLLEPEHVEEGVQYQGDPFTVILKKERSRWTATVWRDQQVLGLGVVQLADKKQRREFIRSLRGLGPDEGNGVDRLLIAVALRAQGDWAAHETWVKQVKLAQKAEAAAAAGTRPRPASGSAS